MQNKRLSVVCVVLLVLLSFWGLLGVYLTYCQLEVSFGWVQLSTEQPPEVVGLVVMPIGEDLQLGWDKTKTTDGYKIFKSLNNSSFYVVAEQYSNLYLDKGAANYHKVSYFVRSTREGVESNDGHVVEYGALSYYGVAEHPIQAQDQQLVAIVLAVFILLLFVFGAISLVAYWKKM